MDRNNKAITAGRLFIRMLLHPVFIIVYGISWFIFARLCKYGNLRMYGLLLAACGIFFVFWLILFFVRLKKKDYNAQFKSRVTGSRIYKAVSVLILLGITLTFGSQVVSSASNLSGHLAWWLEDLRDKRTITLVNDNLYESGIQGILTNIEENIALPDDLYMSSEFELNFSADGTILDFDTYLYGKNKEGETESFLISYNSKNTKKITVYLHGNVDDSYFEAKSLAPLLEVSERIDIKESIEPWIGYGYDTYGILYMGIRDWGYQTNGITYIDPSGETVPAEQSIASAAITNYTVSVYISDLPNGEILSDNGDSLSYYPIRYIPVDSLNKVAEANAKAAELLDEYQVEDSNDVASNGSKVGMLIENSDGSLDYYDTDTLAYRLEVVDAALGSRYYILKKTEDDINWTVLNDAPFLGEGGIAYGLTFLNKDLGFASLAHSGGSYGDLYRTEDGGKTFTKLQLPVIEVQLTPDYFGTPFDYPLMPYYDGNQLMMEVGQGADGGDYHGGCHGLFTSDDNGMTWSYLGEKEATQIK